MKQDAASDQFTSFDSLSEISASSIISQTSQHLYHSLVGSVELPILFGWWPRSEKWNWEELVERTTRCLPAVRPNMDFVALPSLPEVEEIWNCWSQEHGLFSWQVVWFNPRISGLVSNDPALDVCKEVLQSMEGSMDFKGSMDFSFYPMYLTPEICMEAGQKGLPLVGDLEDHMLMPLSQAKAWLHPHISDGCGGPCLHSILSTLGGRVRVPLGFVAKDTHELHEAWRKLQQNCSPGARFVLKPSGGSGGCGVILDVQEHNLDAYKFTPFQSSAILEEMVVGLSTQESPTLYMIGDTPCGPLADQVLEDDGATNAGNRLPSALPDDLFRACTEAAQEINKVWRMKSNWGLDFVLDSNGDPVIVDINMGRPNGNFAVRLWASLSNESLAVYSGAWAVPKNGLSIEKIVASLRSANLLWNGEEGVIVWQHVPGCSSSYAVVSTDGYDSVDRLRANLSKTMLVHHGMAV